MSHIECFAVAQNIGPDQAEESARIFIDWALSSGLLMAPGPLDIRGEMVDQGEKWWAPGPRAIAASTANTLAVVVRVGDELYFPAAIDDSPDPDKLPRCPNCDSTLDEGEMYEAMNQPRESSGWPIVTCPTCSAATDIREWPGDHCPVIGYLAVGFQDWEATVDSDVAERLVAEISAAMGGRWRWEIQRR